MHRVRPEQQCIDHVVSSHVRRCRRRLERIACECGCRRPRRRIVVGRSCAISCGFAHGNLSERNARHLGLRGPCGARGASRHLAGHHLRRGRTHAEDSRRRLALGGGQNRAGRAPRRTVDPTDRPLRERTRQRGRRRSAWRTGTAALRPRPRLGRGRTDADRRPTSARRAPPRPHRGDRAAHVWATACTCR